MAIVYFLLISLSFIMIFITALSNKVLQGVDTEKVATALNYASDFSSNSIENEENLLKTMIIINENSDVIKIISFTLIIIVIVLWMKNKKGGIKWIKKIQLWFIQQ